LRSKLERTVYVAKALNQPAAEEAGSSCEKKMLSAHFGPEMRGLREDQIEIGDR
jgi:hypothetical protein